MPAALHARVSEHVGRALDGLETSGELPTGLARSGVTVEAPRDAAHGDLSTNAAMVMGKRAGVRRGSSPRRWPAGWRRSRK